MQHKIHAGHWLRKETHNFKNTRSTLETGEKIAEKDLELLMLN